MRPLLKCEIYYFIRNWSLNPFNGRLLDPKGKMCKNYEIHASVVDFFGGRGCLGWFYDEDALATTSLEVDVSAGNGSDEKDELIWNSEEDVEAMDSLIDADGFFVDNLSGMDVVTIVFSDTDVMADSVFEDDVGADIAFDEASVMIGMVAATERADSIGEEREEVDSCEELEFLEKEYTPLSSEQFEQLIV